MLYLVTCGIEIKHYFCGPLHIPVKRWTTEYDKASTFASYEDAMFIYNAIHQEWTSDAALKNLKIETLHEIKLGNNGLNLCCT